MLKRLLSKSTKLLVGGLLLLGLFFTINNLFPSNSAAEGTRDCNGNSIIYCGAYTIEELRQKYTGDVPAVFAYYGVTSDMVHGRSGRLVDGIITKSGNVVVNGSTIATGVMSAGREWAPNSTIILGKYYSSAPKDSFLSESIPAFVWLDEKGQFIAAVIKSCGNPASAVAAPPVKVCDASTGNIIEVGLIDKDKYEPVDSPKCKDIKLCRLSDKKIVTIKQAEYDANKSAYSTNLDDCAPPVKVCDPSSGDIITVPEKDKDKYLPVDSDECDEMKVCVIATGELNKIIRVSEFDSTKYSTNPDDCTDMKVCYPATKTISTIKKSDFDADTMTTDFDKCKEAPVIPTTGIESILGGVLGSGALGYGTYTYALSRRAVVKSAKK